MSTSDRATDFDRWIVEEFARTGAFTALAVLVAIGETTVTPLASTYFNVIGDETGWGEITVMFAGAGRDWDGASFYPATAAGGGPLDNPNARLKLRALEARLDDDRLVLNEGYFFDKRGRRMQVEEAPSQ
ncbi:MAG TPA: hypothetical protein VK438_19750 [Xanthobacteraceae bacterium]|nr:hypothetical protein [Xanthobacteraceae bacterium]